MSDDRIQILIVEDDKVVANVYEQMIQKLDGFDVVATAYTGSEATQILHAIKPHLILLDIHLPDMHGIDLLREIRKTHRGIDIIPITAANDAGTVTEAVRGGVFSYLIKPIDFNKLKEELLRYRMTMRRLQSIETMNQKEIDLLLNIPGAAAARKPETPQLQKGIDKFTLKRVRDQVQKLELSVSAEELAGQLGISDSTARKYLEYLSSLNEVEVDIQYGLVGRPERKYKWIRRGGGAP
ncbi:response regulator [Paenibacillus sp. P26]|nr:response regulator [Paenibacillus sp. P26]